MGVLFNDVVINKQSGGLGRRTPSQDMISGLLFNGANVTVDGVNLLEDKKLYRLASIDDAKALGISESYDVDGESAFYQISQFFRMNPSGDLLIYKNSAITTFTNLVEEAEAMQLSANGDIRQIGVIFKGADDPQPKTPKYFDQVTNALAAAKTVTEKAFSDNRPFEMILEGKGFDATKAPVKLDTFNAENVSVVVAMDAEKAGNANYSNSAAVGVLLGAVSSAKVSENIAWIEKFNLTGEGFRSVGFVAFKSQKNLRSTPPIARSMQIGLHMSWT